MPKHLCNLFLSLLCLALLGGVANAADDIRLTYTHGLEEVSFQPPGLADSEDKWDSSTRYEVGLWSVQNGAAFGVSGLMHEADMSKQSHNLDYSSIGARVYLGFSSPISEILTVDLHGFFGYSRSDVDVQVGLNSFTDKGSLLEYGGLAQLTYVSEGSTGLLFGIGGGYMISDGKIDIQGSNSLDQQGIILTGMLGWRF